MKRSVPTIPFRRKREKKTNYRKRLGLLKSGKHRLVIRKSNKYIVVQLVEFDFKGDKIIKGITSKNLIEMGWKFSCKNIPAAYLTGLLISNTLKNQKDKNCIADFGLQTPLKGNNRLYATLKGAIDGGLIIPADDSIFPAEDKLFAKDKSPEMQKAFEDIKKKLL